MPEMFPMRKMKKVDIPRDKKISITKCGYINLIIIFKTCVEIDSISNYN